ncbi:hypothetical protein C8R43DRAFT_1325 [Mycena crocata]|nr:hypothetical protein C8R43DRAFT_1325 [Mycena crocata]
MAIVASAVIVAAPSSSSCIFPFGVFGPSRSCQTSSTIQSSSLLDPFTSATNSPLVTASPLPFTSSASGNGLSTGTIVALCVSIGILVVTAVVAVVVWVRHRSTEHSATDPENIQIFTAVETRTHTSPRTANKSRMLTVHASTVISNNGSRSTLLDPDSNSTPITANDSDVRRTRLSTVTPSHGAEGRQQLESELLAAQEKMGDLEALDLSSTRASRGSSVPRRVLRLVSMRSTTSSQAFLPNDGAGPDLGAELQAAREQINLLVMRINMLEAQAGPTSTRDSLDEPPPDYLED